MQTTLAWVKVLPPCLFRVAVLSKWVCVQVSVVKDVMPVCRVSLQLSSVGLRATRCGSGSDLVSAFRVACNAMVEHEAMFLWMVAWNMDDTREQSIAFDFGVQ